MQIKEVLNLKQCEAYEVEAGRRNAKETTFKSGGKVRIGRWWRKPVDTSSPVVP